jgi:lipopolysaccharide/colanic/teichoic acid biosynthesis glycosyltransferase
MTPLGRVLGETKLDELPQLWNVLKGDMSIIGPRPESLEFADCFADAYRSVLNHKPGIFGPSQAFFRDECLLFPAGGDPTHFYRNVLFPLKARFDLSYYPTRTIKSDLVWLVRAVLAVVGRQPSAALPGASRDAGEWPANWASTAGVSEKGPLTWVR